MCKQEKKDFFQIYSVLGQRIKEERRNQGLRQLDLAVMTGINESYISEIENAKNVHFRLSTYLQIIFFLDVDPDDFFKGFKEISPFSDKDID